MGAFSHSINLWLELSQVYWYKQGYCTGVSVYQCLFCIRDQYNNSWLQSVWYVGKSLHSPFVTLPWLDVFWRNKRNPKPTVQPKKRDSAEPYELGWKRSGVSFSGSSAWAMWPYGRCFRAYSVLMLFVSFSGLLRPPSHKIQLISSMTEKSTGFYTL